MKIFPYFSKVFYSPLVVKCIASKLHYYLNTDTRFVVHKFDEQEFAFDIKADSFFLYNSFLPTVEITVFGRDPVNVKVSVSLRKSTKVMMCFLLILAAFFEIALCLLRLANYFPTLLLLLPLGIIIITLIGSHVGLRLSAKNVFMELINMLNANPA